MPSSRTTEVPIPPRYRWLRQLTVSLVAGIVGFVVLMRWWQHEAQCRIDAEVASIRARGEPILLKEFDLPAIDSDANAAIPLTQAATIVARLDYVMLRNPRPIQPVTPEMRQTLENMAQGAAMARRLARQARSLPQCNWDLGSSAPGTPLHNQIQLSRFLSSMALLEHSNGNDAEAIESVRDMIRHAESMDHASPTLLVHLIRAVCLRNAAETVELLCGDLHVMRLDHETAASSGPATTHQLRQLLAELLNDVSFRSAGARAVFHQRAAQYDVMTKAPSTPGLDTWSTTLPMYQLDMLRTIRQTGSLARAMQASDFPSAKALLNGLDHHYDQQTAASGMVQAISMISAVRFEDRAAELFEVLAQRRMAALCVAVRLYRRDHDEKFPDRLEELVPDDLPALPADPFRSDGGGFEYRTTPRPNIYSVGRYGNNSGTASRPVPLLGPAPTSQPAAAATTRAHSAP